MPELLIPLGIPKRMNFIIVHILGKPSADFYNAVTRAGISRKIIIMLERRSDDTVHK